MFDDLGIGLRVSEVRSAFPIRDMQRVPNGTRDLQRNTSRRGRHGRVRSSRGQDHRVAGLLLRGGV